MKLISARIRNFRNILDSGEVKFQPDVTCVVGKNESGKTAFLQALHRLNPAGNGPKFSVPDHYPAWLEKRDRRTMNLEEFCPATATFQIEDADRSALEEKFGSGILASNQVTLSKRYDGQRIFGFKSVDTTAIKKIGVNAARQHPNLQKTDGCKSLAELDELIDTLRAGGTSPDGPVQADALDAARADILGKSDSIQMAVLNALDDFIPKFFYYAEYSNLSGTVKIQDILKGDRSKLNPGEQTALSLLELAGAEDDYLLNPVYERRKRELENVANALTQDILDYWTTNQELRVEIDITQRNITVPNGNQSILDELKIRLYDGRHSLSLPFDERSTGFRWFFSFLAAFSVYEESRSPVVILLDEPGLGLHARAQKDFLRFIDERLSPKQQVVFTTHSPFMVQPGKLERVRLVEDKGRKDGTKVSSDILSTDPDTLFPLQGALGYDIAQHLLIGSHNLIAEGTSDLTYLIIMSRHLQDIGREGMDDKWSIVPVGGADMIPTFVALLGHHLDVTVLVDSQRAGHQRLENLAANGMLEKSRLIMVGDVLGRKLADIEDVFIVEDYLLIYNLAFDAKLTIAQLTGTDPVLHRIERHTGRKYDHGKPADILLRERDKLLPKFSSETIDRFEKLFKAINSTLPKI